VDWGLLRGVSQVNSNLHSDWKLGSRMMEQPFLRNFSDLLQYLDPHTSENSYRNPLLSTTQ